MTHVAVGLLFSISMNFDILTPKLMGLQDSCWNIFMSCLVTLAAFFRYRADKQQTYKTPVTPVTSIGVGNSASECVRSAVH